ncbi:MAG: diacylglycerol kinase family protein [Firmicutes bacterium]|nr:diacylglycerol kinase family protein [Dethiobacter sp.]MBS3899263.1 diacylglycerol kinase family protein [Dethiobacter sp.]MCL4464242.1 diacylglycerol kinase family protein [Bacillota bacterium]MCL5993321.1 diacylglycerol kinase family protein [Bacillota bacterium]
MGFKAKDIRASFRHALCGLADAWHSERNMRIHSFAAALAIIAGFWLKLDKAEWLFLLSAIFLVVTMEMLNTALERVVDLFTREYHPLARLAKNAAAGAALLASLYALVVGLIIFLPLLADKINIF